MHTRTTRSLATRLGAGLAAAALLATASAGTSAADEAGPNPVFSFVKVYETTTTRPDRTILIAEIHIPPGGGVDWHRHPGLTSVTVMGEGTFTLMEQNCSSTEYHAGDTFVPPYNWHTARNFSDQPVIGRATFVYHGDRPTILAPQSLDDNLDRNCGLAG